MTDEDVSALAQDIIALHQLRARVRADLERCENVMLLQLQPKQILEVDGYTLRARPGRSPRLSPSQRRRIREDHPTALLGMQQPPYLAVERIRE